MQNLNASANIDNRPVTPSIPPRAYHLIADCTRYLRDDLKFTAETYFKQFDNLNVHPNRLRYSQEFTGNNIDRLPPSTPSIFASIINDRSTVLLSSTSWISSTSATT